jgi:hypothetical protein
MTARKPLFIIERILMWFLWCVWCEATVYQQMTLAGQRHNTASLTFPTDVFALSMYCIPVALTLSMRWLAIPRIKTPFVGLIPFMAGLFSAAVLNLFGLFLFEKHCLLFSCTAWILLLQLVPLWKRQVGPPPLPPPA